MREGFWPRAAWQMWQTKIRRGGHTTKGSLSRPEAVGAAVGRLVLPPYTVLTQHISRGQAVPSPTGSDVRWPWVVPISVWAPATGLPSRNSFLNACREPKIGSHAIVVFGAEQFQN